MVFYHHTIRIMTSRVNTNISSISVDDIAVLTMTVVDTGVGWGSRVGVGSLVASEMVKEGLQYKKITLTFVINAASVPSGFIPHCNHSVAITHQNAK